MSEETNSGAHGGAESKDEEVVFTTIFRKDRDWLNRSVLIGKNRAGKLHKIIEYYRSQHPE